MKKKILSLVSIFIVVATLAGLFASCGTGTPANTTERPSTQTTEAATDKPTEAPTSTPTEKTTDESTEAPTETSSEKPTETPTEVATKETEEATTEETTEIVVLEGEHGALVQNANALANVIQSYYADESHKAFVITNQNMTMEYCMNTALDQQVSYINNKDGKPYVSNTMDVFVKLADGSILYAAGSNVKAVPNVYRLGYYYHEARFEGQTFVNGDKTLSTIATARVFHAYSDKLHHELQVAARETTSGIAEIGMITKIAENTVAAIVVKDANGLHESLEGVDWATAEYIGFDIIDVGVFGYILPVSELAGNMTVTLEGGEYVIIQSRAPENNTIPAVEGSCEDMVGKSGNTNDFYMGQRIYTDDTHSFDGFLKEAYIERNPLTAKNIKVSTAYSDMGRLVGYDPIRGAYEFYLKGTDFNTAYYTYPNRHYRLNFTIMGDEYERNIYILAATPNGSLETSVLLDENLMMLPVPIEVCKNFGTDETSWPNLHDAFDLQYGEAIFPILLVPGELREYNLLHLYQNWGKFPLKQISSIEYIAPYYHMSTGVTESNCLVPWGWMDTGIENILPDHRGMSAPLWEHQPQHEAAGEHRATKYTSTVTGNTVTPELTYQNIDSYGPTYLDLTSVYEANDDIFTLTTNYVEMPQLDENRAYYSMEYVFTKEATFTNFSRQFSFYAMCDKWSITHRKVGYLNENNECVVVDTDNKESHKMFVLGDESPYFSYFDSPTTGIYCNLSYIIKDYTITINGEKSDVHFAIRKNGSWIYLTLDLENVTFKEGDKISFNAIILPWGSEKSDYSGNTYAPDQNVRDVRENTCLNPITLTAGANSEVIESAFVPKVKSTDGKSAEFTISGGAVSQYEIPYRDSGYNMTVRVYGFDTLTVPKIYEKIDGEWVVYEISSATSLDKNGFGAYYDGYNVYYDGDGKYSYAFVIDMSEAKDRTFKVELDESFEKWPRIEGTEVAPDPIDVYFDPLELKGRAGGVAPWFTSMDLKEDAGVSYINFTANPYEKYGKDAYFTIFSNNEDETGRYLIIKYRSNATDNVLQFFSSTRNAEPAGSDGFNVPSEVYIRDGEWHILILDMYRCLGSTFRANSDGQYIAKYLRFDVFNFGDKTFTPDDYIDVAYIGMCPDLETLITLDNTTGDVYFYNRAITMYDPNTGAEK